MQLSVSTVSIVIITVLVLAVLAIFITQSTGKPLQTSNSAKVFAEKCNEYKQQDCPWSVTRQEGFDSFLAACRDLYGSDKEKYSCLYNACQQCARGSENDNLCYTLCDEARANKQLGVNHVPACDQFASECGSSSVVCGDVCEG